MRFSYFTLSDNAYANNPRGPNTFVADILDEAIFADRIGMHAAWIGEHHFSTLGVNSSPEVLLTYIAARTQRIRLAPAVTVLPLHHPIRVAEQWATIDLLSGGRVDFACGRGYDRREYEPFEASFEGNAAVLAEGLEIVDALWRSEAPLTHHGAHYNFDNVTISPRPVQSPVPIYVASFSKPTIELAARLGLGLVVAAGQASGMHGGLAQVANLYKEACARHSHPPRGLITSYFIHFADTPEQERAARERQLRYHQECTQHAFPGDPKTAPADYKYFEAIVNRYKTMTADDFTDAAVLIGNADRIAEIIQSRIAAAGFDEVILYFNLGLKPHQQVKDEMQRFMEQVAPKFAASKVSV